MNKKIVIDKPRIDGNTVIWPICIDGTSKNVQTSVSDNLVPFLTVDRIDPIVMGLLVFAIRNGYDFRSSIPISDELLYNLTRHFIPAIAYSTHKPLIEAPVAESLRPTGQIVATGISCGVDSLYTVATHTDLPNPAGNLSHLAFFDAGSHHSDKSPSKTKEGRRNLAMRFAKNYGFGYMEVSTNLPDLIDEFPCGYSHVENHTFMMLYCVLTVAKGVKRYYYSSGHDFRDFNCSYVPNGDFDASYYDLLTLTAASFGPTLFISSGGESTRLEKLKLLVDYKPAHKFLNVCVSAFTNDNICFKCVRTLIEIDALGAIDRFAEVFDIEYYKRNRNWYLQQAYVGAIMGDVFYQEVLPYFKSDMTLGFKIKAIVKKAISVIKNRL